MQSLEAPAAAVGATLGVAAGAGREEDVRLALRDMRAPPEVGRCRLDPC
jgi:hypothetical protein